MTNTTLLQTRANKIAINSVTPTASIPFFRALINQATPTKRAPYMTNNNKIAATNSELAETPSSSKKGKKIDSRHACTGRASQRGEKRQSQPSA